MSKKIIKKYSEIISFRLLATKKHVDYEWLEKTLFDLIDKVNKKQDDETKDTERV